MLKTAESTTEAGDVIDVLHLGGGREYRELTLHRRAWRGWPTGSRVAVADLGFTTDRELLERCFDDYFRGPGGEKLVHEAGRILNERDERQRQAAVDASVEEALRREAQEAEVPQRPLPELQRRQLELTEGRRRLAEDVDLRGRALEKAKAALPGGGEKREREFAQRSLEHQLAVARREAFDDQHGTELRELAVDVKVAERRELEASHEKAIAERTGAAEVALRQLFVAASSLSVVEADARDAVRTLEATVAAADAALGTKRRAGLSVPTDMAPDLRDWQIARPRIERLGLTLTHDGQRDAWIVTDDGKRK